uniref:FimD/PapC C-terminal domain-containing protein n=1 Tax=Escherichia coli TaxID=562 RepID=UPI002378E8AE
GTVCVVGKMRDLILQLSKSSIYSTKPAITQRRALLNITLSDGKKLPRGVAIEDSEGNYLTTSVDDGVVFLNNIKPDMVLDIKDEQQSCRIHLTFPEDAPKDVFYETATGECQ